MEKMDAQLMNHIEHLSTIIGARPIGSLSNRATAECIRGTFEQLGLPIEFHTINCPAWERQNTILEVDRKRYPAISNSFSPSCDITAAMKSVCTIHELELADFTNRIAMLYGDLTQGTGFGCKSGYYYPERDQKVIQLLEEKQPLAVLMVHSKTETLSPLIHDWQFPLPSATVPAEVGRKILEINNPIVRLRIESHTSTGEFGSLIATQVGQRAERVIVCAHFDSMPDSPGAIDNASGVAVMLTLARLFSEKSTSLTLEWLAINGEENGGLGDAVYLKQKGETLSQVLALINVDGVGDRIGANSVTMLSSSKDFQDHIATLRQSFPGMVWVDAWYESDHTAFAFNSVPCIAISSKGVSNIHHSPYDTVDWISPFKLREVVLFISSILDSLQDKTIAWAREQA